jgi:hypothetical protein
VTGSSTRLVSDPTAVSSVTLSWVPAGIVISRVPTAGAASGAAGASAVPAVATGALFAPAALLTGVANAFPGTAASVLLQPVKATPARSALNNVIRMSTSTVDLSSKVAASG